MEVAEARVARASEERVASGRTRGRRARGMHKRKYAWHGQAEERVARASARTCAAALEGRWAEGSEGRGARNWRAESSSAARESVRLVFRVFFVCACLFALWCVRHQRPLKKSPPPPPPGLQRAAPARRDGDRLDQHDTPTSLHSSSEALRSGAGLPAPESTL